MKPVQIPRPSSPDNEMENFIGAVKENIEVLRGMNRGAIPIKKLEKTATLEDVILTVNLIIDRLGG